MGGWSSPLRASGSWVREKGEGFSGLSEKTKAERDGLRRSGTQGEVSGIHGSSKPAETLPEASPTPGVCTSSLLGLVWFPLKALPTRRPIPKGVFPLSVDSGPLLFLHCGGLEGGWAPFFYGARD